MIGVPLMWAILAIVLGIALAAVNAAYEHGVDAGWRTAMNPRDPLWNKTRLILRKFGEKVRLTTECVRAPGDEECVEYEFGPSASRAECETDGHYLCGGCVWNHHRVPNHECRTPESCAFPNRMRKDED